MIQEAKDLMDDRETETRRKAVEELKGMPAGRAIPLLIKAMEDTNWRVRKTAAMIIEGYPLALCIKGLVGLLHLSSNAGARNTAIEVLTKTGRESISYLIEAYGSRDADVRKSIVDIAGNIKDNKTLPLLLLALKDEDENIKASAVEALGYLDEPEVVDILIGVLKSGDLWTAFPAAAALGRIGDKRAVPALLDALSLKALREPVLNALGRLSDAETLDRVVQFLEGPSLSIQEEALLAIEMFYHNNVPSETINASLKRVCGNSALDRLTIHLSSKRNEVKTAAILVLGLMQYSEAIGRMLELYTEEYLHKDISKALLYMGQKNPGCLIPYFEVDNHELRRFVISTAAKVAAPVYYGLFRKMLTDSDGHIRAIAAIGLSRTGGGKAIKHLWNLLSDPFLDVQDAAVTALGSLREGLKVNELIKRLKDNNPCIRKNAALLIGRTGAVSAINALCFALKDEDESVRRAVVEALSNIKTDEASDLLTLALTDEKPEIRAAAALSLGNIAGRTAFDTLVLLMKDPDDNVRVASARSLGMLNDRRAVSTLVVMLSDPNGFVVTSAMDSLSRIGGDEAREAIEKMLNSDDREIRRTAIKSLAPFDGIEDMLLPYLKDPDWATRIAALEALSSRRNEKLLSEVRDLLHSESEPLVKKMIRELFDV